MMTETLDFALSKLTKNLEDEVKELKLANQQLERQKAARALQEELQLLRCKNQELTRQMTEVDQSEEKGEKIRTSHEKTVLALVKVSPQL